jgi:hypothetical protein
MARIITAGVAGAVIYFIWGMLAWMVIPLHDSTVLALPQERAIVDALAAQNLETGVYVAPYADDPAAMSDPESAFMKNHQAGPIVSIYYQKQGAVPMNVGVLLTGFLIDLLGAALAACLLSSIGACGRSYWCRVGFVTGLGVFVALMGHASYWNWMSFPAGYTLAFMIDVIVGWFLAGLAIAWLIKPSETTDSATQIVAAPVALSEPKKSSTPKPAQPTAPIRNDAITLLAALQREARFVDIVKEPLGNYTNEQVGAATRDVLRDCGTVLDRMFKLGPIIEQEEGAQVEIPAGADSDRYRITGKTTDETTAGALVHHGWQAQQCELPKWTGSKESALIISPAELEVK